MEKIDEEKIETEETPLSTPIEAEDSIETITEEIKEIQEKKESKVITKPELDLSVLNTFKDKIIKEFGLTEKIDVHGCYGLYYNDYIVLKLLPRKNCRFGVWREVPEKDNKWRAFRINTDEEEQKVINHIKLFIETNSKE